MTFLSIIMLFMLFYILYIVGYKSGKLRWKQIKKDIRDSWNKTKRKFKKRKTLPEKFTVIVKPEHFKNARFTDNRDCPLARACKEYLKRDDITVGASVTILDYSFPEYPDYTILNWADYLHIRDICRGEKEVRPVTIWLKRKI
jgi:hypothetical protein